jgi:hypothetical protein
VTATHVAALAADRHADASNTIEIAVGESPERVGEFYRSRIIIAEFAGVAAAFGPVRTAQGLTELVTALEVGGWSVSGHLKLTSVANLKAQSCDWAAAAASRAKE